MVLHERLNLTGGSTYNISIINVGTKVGKVKLHRCFFDNIRLALNNSPIFLETLFKINAM